MTTDIRTMEEVEIDGFTVAVGKQRDNRDIYDAAVIEETKSPMAQTVSSVFGDSTENKSIVREAPIASHGSLYIAVGMAVQQYLDSFGEGEDYD